MVVGQLLSLLQGAGGLWHSVWLGNTGMQVPAFEDTFLASTITHACRPAPLSIAATRNCHGLRLQIVNLVSNDVRRFDDAMPVYNFLIGGPGQESQYRVQQHCPFQLPSSSFRQAGGARLSLHAGCYTLTAGLCTCIAPSQQQQPAPLPRLQWS